MVSERTRPMAVAGAVLALLLWSGPLQAQPQQRSASGIYTCEDARGRRLTSDRPIAECIDREQKVLNRDGSLQRVLPPTLTAEERAERDAAQRVATQQRAATADAVRRDRNLMTRFPNEAAHAKAREGALDTVRLAMRATELRLQELASERKPLLNEAEFYQGKPRPALLRQRMDATDAGVAAQRAAAKNQEAELARISQLYDAELGRLRRLWAGAAPGSLSPASASTR